MSFSERLKAKFSPEAQAKAQVKRYLKSKIPQAREGMEDFLDQLFLQAAEANKENPFELLLVVSNKKGQVLGEIYNLKKKKLGATNIGELAEAILMSQLDAMPSFLKDAINEGLENLDLSIGELFAKELSRKKLIVKYNRDSELIYIEMDGKHQQIVDLAKIINNLDF